jgi:hypothetical protein
VAGVISRGPVRCDGPIKVARVTETIDFLRRKLSKEGGDEQFVESCAQCQAVMAVDDGPCLTVAKRCERDAACKSFRDDVARGNEAGYAAQGTGGASRYAQWTCLCQTRCRDACATLCGPPADP